MTDKDPFPNARDLSIHAGSTDLEDRVDFVITKHMVNLFLVQVRNDRKVPYWSEGSHKDTLDNVQAWLESLRDTLDATDEVRDGRYHFCEICKGLANHKTSRHPWPSREEATDGSSPRVTSTDLRHDAQLRGDHGYVHHATVRNLMRRLANHMDRMAEIEAGDAPEVVDEPWDEITAKHWKEIKGGLITIKEAYEKG